MATETTVSEFRTVIEGDPEPVPSEERERLAALDDAKRQNGPAAPEGTPPTGGSEVVRSASLESEPGSRSGSSTRSLSRSSSNRSKKELLVLKGQAVGALPRGASQDDDELGGVIERAGIAPSEGGEVHESIVGDTDPVPEQEEERQAAVAEGAGKKGVGARIKEKFAGLFGGRGGAKKGTASEPAGSEKKDEVDAPSKAADLGSGWTGADALTRDASKGVTSGPDVASAGGERGTSELPDNHWGPGIGSGGAAVNELEGVNDDGVIRIRGGAYDSDEELELDPPGECMSGGAFDTNAVMRLRGGGDTGGDLAKEEAAAETVLEAGAKKSTGLTACGGSVFRARKEGEDDTEYDHGVKGVGTGKEPAEAHGVNTHETGKVKAPGLGGRIKEELEAFAGMLSGKTEK